MVVYTTMSRSMTDLLREAMREAIESGISIRQIARDNGITHPSLIGFLRETQSLHLEHADRLAEYLGIECRRTDKPLPEPDARRRKTDKHKGA